MALRTPILPHAVMILVSATMLIGAESSTLHAVEESLQPAVEEVAESIDSSDEEVVVIATEQYGSVRVGGRIISMGGEVATAAPYSTLKSGPATGFSAGTIGADLKLSASATFFDSDDYHAELSFDGGGAYRFNLESQALWHNLPNEQLPSGTINLAPGKKYDFRISTHEGGGRIRIGNHPIHLMLGYFELHREGTVQTRFSDVYGASNNSVYSTASSQNQTTREGTLGLDGQAGSLGIAYTFRIRDFSQQSPPTSHTFANNAGGAANPGNQAFAVTPDNRTVAHTIKIYNDMSGGLTGTAAYSHVTRENNGGKGDSQPSSAPRDIIQAASGDLRYTPSSELSFALKYRHQDIERHSPATVTTQFLTIGTTPVHPSSDSSRDTVLMSANYQPLPSAQVKLEYQAELESRSDLQNRQKPDDVALREKDSRQIHSGRFIASWKPLNGIKLTARYGYATCDNPAYGNSFAEQHTGQFFATFTRGGRWGTTLQYLGRYETSTMAAQTANPVILRSLPRESFNNSLHASVWFAPLKRLTITTSYTYLASDTDQMLLFTPISIQSLAASNYSATSHQYGIDAMYAASQQLELGLSIQQIFSRSRFTVAKTAFSHTDSSGITSTYTTDGITPLTILDATETAVAARADWHINDRYGVSMEYGFRNYFSGNSIFDGTSHSIMTLLTGRW